MTLIHRLTRGYKDSLDHITNQILFLEYSDKLPNSEVYARKLFGGHLALQQ